jgi:ribosomal protein S18 acetylase RimI-like enzyme
MNAELSTTPELVIRKATRADLDVLGDLWIELMTFHSERDDRFVIPEHGRANYMRHINMALHDSYYLVLVAEENRRVIGYVIGYIAQNPPIFPYPTYGFIADICVTHTARRHGAGSQLVHGICQWFRAHGMNNIQMNVAHLNPVSQAFWRKMGGTDYLDHMWMQLDL